MIAVLIEPKPWVRNQQELQKVIAYIERNPVSAGFVSKPEDWRWSSAWVD